MSKQHASFLETRFVLVALARIILELPARRCREQLPTKRHTSKRVGANRVCFVGIDEAVFQAVREVARP